MSSAWLSRLQAAFSLFKASELLPLAGNYLSDHLYKVLGVLWREPLELAGTGLQGGRVCHYQDVIP